MKPGPVSTALLWICWACQVHIILGSRPSRDFLRVLTTVDDRINRSQIDEWPNKNNHNQIESGPDDGPVFDFDTANLDIKGAKNYGNHRSDPDDHPECRGRFQKQAAEQVLRSFNISFNETTTGDHDHCQYRGIRCGAGCKVIGVDLSWHREVVESEFNSGSMGPWDDLTYLQDLNISGTRVRGDISAFKKMVKLSSVDLSNSTVEGDIGAFRRMRQLKYLDLSQTQVFGDIRVFSSQKLKADGANMTQLRHLNLAHTKVSGNIQNFQHSSSLEYLNLQAIQASGDIEYLRFCPLKQILLRDTGVGGNIRVVQAFPDLTHLDLQNTLIFGDIRAFETTQKMQGLWLSATGVLGDIACFEGNKDLEELDLSLTDVSGDIQVFEHTILLTKMALDATRVQGDVKVFWHLSSLISLRSSSTKLWGDIGVFKNATSLLHLQISDAQVLGDLAALEHTATLQTLYLRKSPVHGNLSALQGAADLHELDLSDTPIQGDISILQNKTGLSRVWLSSTSVTGDIDVFRNNSELISVDLSFTNVTGDIWAFKGLHMLSKLRMASTGVRGDLGTLVSASSISYLTVVDLSGTMVHGLEESLGGGPVDLSRTRVTGRLTQHWRGCCKHLRALKLSASRAEFLPSGTDLTNLLDVKDTDQDVLLPALTTLEVSGCPLNGQLRDLILPLASCEHLGSIIAVNSGLYGELPNLDPLGPIKMNGAVEVVESSKLASSLEFLELSQNNLTLIESIPASARKLIISKNAGPLRLAEGALSGALKRGVLIDLRFTTLHSEIRKEAETLLVMHRTAERTFQRDGYTCYDLSRDSTTLLVTPPDFLPDELCGCVPGWYGQAATCRECPADTFNPAHGAGTCIPCPPHGTTEGRKAQTECKLCEAFRPHKGGKRTEGSACECPSGSAIYEHDCLECFAPSARCLGGNLSTSYCATGYHGPLCMRCSEHYYAANGLCIACSRGGFPPWLVRAMTFVAIGALFLGFLVAVAVFVYSSSLSHWLQRWMNLLTSAIFAPGALGEWQQQLLKRQAPVLLLMGQLWSVLSALLRRDDNKASSSLWEAPYIEYLQLAVGGAKEVLYLQCFYAGEKVRLLLALTAPMVPLVLLLCCVLLELFKRGSGVNAALKILTLFFVGGASKCAALISCQQVDAGGWPLQHGLFLRHLPDLKCDSKQMVPPEVEHVFWPCAMCYAVLIPAFLMYLYARQHVVLRYTRMPLALTAGSNREHLAVSHQDFTLQRRLLAGLVAYVSMLQHGSVRIQLRDGKGTVTFLDTPNGAALEFDEEATKAQFTVESEKLRHHAIAEMLLERHVLDEVGNQDRLLLGAKETLLKYASCRDLWMEVVLKLVAVVIVQAVASSTATRDFIPLGKVLVATLAVAAAVWMVQPYAQPQVNALQVCCFISLALAATGFGFDIIWLSRAALLLPLMLAAAQQMQPDSPESLAQRLWEDLVKDGVPKESATASMLTRRQSREIHVSLERD